MRFASLILFYDCDPFILRTIANCAPHVERIYVSYSPYPWAYNPEAREKFRNPSDPSLLEQSPHRDKIELVEGDWPTEEAQRNEVLVRARAAGFDGLVVQDADEFFHTEDYRANLTQIERNPGFAYYRTPWYQFWKTRDYVILCRESLTYRAGKVDLRIGKTTTAFSMAFVLNLRTDVCFDHCRRPTNLDDYLVLDRPCYHLSFVLSDAQVERKIRTYGHTNQIRHQRWLKNKWYGWTPATRCLHPLNPVAWLKAVPFEGRLPEEIADLPAPRQESRSLGQARRLADRLGDLRDLVGYSVKRLRIALRGRAKAMNS